MNVHYSFNIVGAFNILDVGTIVELILHGAAVYYANMFYSYVAICLLLHHNKVNILLLDTGYNGIK